MRRSIIDSLAHCSAILRGYVSVDEEGTAAEAAGSAGMVSASASATFIADRPFVFAIRDKLTEMILFLGRVEDPTAA